MKVPPSIRIGGAEYNIEKSENARLGNQLCYGTIEYYDRLFDIKAVDNE